MAANSSPAVTPNPSVGGTSVSSSPSTSVDPNKVTANWRTIVQQLRKVFAMEQEGKFNSKLAMTVRHLIAEKPYDILAYWAALGDDPLVDIPPSMNPSLEARNPETKAVIRPIITPKDFAARLRDARALVKSKVDSGEIVARAPGNPQTPGPSTPTGGASAAAAGTGAMGAVAPPPVAMHTAPTGAQAAAAGTPIQQVVPPPGILSIQIVSALIRNESARRHWIAEKADFRVKQWSTSLQWWTEYQNRQKQLGQSGAPSVGPSQGAGAGGPGTPMPGMSFQPRPFNLQMPPVPVEPEDERRRRKYREYLQEQAPGMELEWGANGIMNDVLDSFVDEAVRGAIRLAKHRKSNRVETKDMAAFLEFRFGMSVPGFDALVPKRVHVQPEGERKRGRGLAPRATRLRGAPKDE